MERCLGGLRVAGLKFDPCNLSTFQPTGATLMNAHVKSYLWFLAFMGVTKIVVAPVAKQLNIPLVSDIVG